LTDLEGWDYTPADFARLLALSPEGCFAAEDDGQIISVLTTTSYGGLAFLGAVIVLPAFRGRGLGKLMMEAALEHLSRTGVETVRLNAYANVIPFYEHLGFQREYEVVRWKGVAPIHTSQGARPAEPADIDALVSLDAPLFGARRDRLIRRLLKEMGDAFLVATARSRLLGYIVGNVSDETCEIGPWVVTPGRATAAQDLFHGLVAATGCKEVALSGPVRNPDLAPFLREIGFEEVFRTLRMWRGKDAYPGNPAGLWAAAGLEKG
jgi:predicted GNAT family acetyltransferase